MMFCASAILASCAGILDEDKTPVQNGEIEKSYIAINLMSADPDTRADGATYQDGSEAERKVNSAYFFFFQNGQPFPVTVTDGAVTAPGTGANFLSATLTGNTGKASFWLADGALNVHPHAVKDRKLSSVPSYKDVTFIIRAPHHDLM